MAVAGVVFAVVIAVGLLLAIPVLSGSASTGNRASGAPADEQVTEVPVSAVGGFGLTAVLGTGLWLGLRRRGPGDP